MNLVTPLILIIISSIITDLFCRYTNLLLWLKNKFKIKLQKQVDLISLYFILSLALITYFLYRLNLISKEIINFVGLPLITIISNINSNIKKEL